MDRSKRIAAACVAVIVCASIAPAAGQGSNMTLDQRLAAIEARQYHLENRIGQMERLRSSSDTTQTGVTAELSALLNRIQALEMRLAAPQPLAQAPALEQRVDNLAMRLCDVDAKASRFEIRLTSAGDEMVGVARTPQLLMECRR